MRLSQLKKESVITRRFAFPPEAKPAERFTVDLSYLSPALFAEKREQVKVKIVGGGRKRTSDEINEQEFKKLLISDVLVHTVKKIEGCTLRKLRRLVSMSPEAVAAAGGLDTELVMDPSGEKKQESLDNIIDLLDECSDFFNWLVNVCTDLGNFQDEEWEEQVGNSRPGQASSTAQP